MPEENPFPLPITEKIDSWEKIQLLANVPDNYKYTAGEWNIIRQALTYLYENLGGGSGTSTPSTLERQFGAGAVTITAGANTTPQEICDHINSVGFTVTAGQIIILALTVKKTISGQAYWYRQKRFFKRNNLVGTWGTGSTNGEIVPADIIALVYDVVQTAYTDSEDNVFINLGDLGSTAIHTYLNAFAGSIPGLTANELVDDGSIYYFECIIGEVYQTYKYIGSVPVTLGSGGDTVASGDFDLYSSSGIDSQPFGIQTIIPGTSIVSVDDTDANNVVVSVGEKILENWVSRVASEANPWASITYGNGLFVAVAYSGTNRVMTSPDGITWTSRSASSASNWGSVTYGNGLFVAVAYGGTNRVMTSPDGITWTNRTPSESNNWQSITYGNGLFVAVSSSGTNRVMTSPDGITWTSRSAAQQNYWAGVTYGNGLFVAVSHDGTNRIMTSPDGITWTSRNAPSAITWNSVAYGNGLFVAVSLNGTNKVMTSVDGINWTGIFVSGNASWCRVSYGNGWFVAVANTGTNRILVSPNGINWEVITAPEENDWLSVVYGDGNFVAVSGNGTNRVMTSEVYELLTLDRLKVNGKATIGEYNLPLTDGANGQVLTAHGDGTATWENPSVGADGADGDDGADGLSAYELAVAEGFIGDVTAWLASLVGPQGDEGPEGPEGPQGDPGADGADGAPGSDASVNSTNVNAAGAVMESDYNAHTILSAITDNTPTPITISESQVVGRLPSGNIKGLSRTELINLLALEDAINIFIEEIENKDYILALRMPFSGNFVLTTSKSTAGTCTATFKIGSTALGGSANSVSTTEQDQAHASANAFTEGDTVVLTISSNAACLNASFTMKLIRTA